MSLRAPPSWIFHPAVAPVCSAVVGASQSEGRKLLGSEADRGGLQQTRFVQLSFLACHVANQHELEEAGRNTWAYRISSAVIG